MNVMRIAATAVLFWGTVAVAQSAPVSAAAPAPVDAARLVKAQRLVRVLNIDRLMKSINASMLATMQDSMIAAASASDGGAARRADPYFDDRMKRVATVIANALQTDMQASIAKLMDGSAEIYAAQFSDSELDAMLAFYESAAGRSIMEKLPAVLGDPRMRALQAEMSKSIAARMPEIMRKAKAAADTLPPPPPVVPASGRSGG